MLVSAALFSLLLAASLFIARTVSVNRRYTVLIGVADSTPYIEKRDSYIEAVKLCPQRTTAYIKLLEAYEQNSRFDIEESAEFTALYNSAKELWNEKGGGELAYLAGRMYIGFYTENGEQVSMSAKVQRAGSYFSGSVENPPKDENVAVAARCYDAICRYYRGYILAASDKLELTDSVVAGLFAEARSALDAIQSGTEFDKLNLAEAICNLLYDQRAAFAAAAPDRSEEAVTLLETAVTLAAETAVTRPELIEVRERVLANREEFEAAVIHAYNGNN